MPGLRKSLREINPLNDYSAELNEYMEEAGIEPKSVISVDEGDLVETYILEHHGEREVFQYTEDSVDQLVRGSRAYELLGEEVNVPEVRERGIGDGYAWHRVEFLNGEPPETEQEMREYGKAIAELHSVDVPDSYGLLKGLEGEGFDTEGATNWHNHLGDQLVWRTNYLAGEGYLDMELRERLFDVWSMAREEMPETPEASVLHGDLARDNVVMGDQTTLIDFDQAAIGDPAYEVMRVKTDLNEFDENSEAFMEGYTRIRDEPELDSDTEHVYRIAGALANLQVMKFKDKNTWISLEEDDINEQKRRIEQSLDELEELI